LFPINLDIDPIFSLPPLLCCTGVNPKQAAASLPFLKCVALPKAIFIKIAQTGPTPSTACNHLQVSSCLMISRNFPTISFASSMVLTKRLKITCMEKRNVNVNSFSASSSNSGIASINLATP